MVSLVVGLVHAVHRPGQEWARGEPARSVLRTLSATDFFYPDQPDTPRAPVDELVHHAALPDGLLDRKVAALAAHATQTAALIERVGASTYREWWRTETFRRAEAVPARLQIAGLHSVAA
jgi:LmbE family N-acetylglucosaminyl deacetylase